MKTEEPLSPAFQHDVIEFVTVAVQYCAYLENLQGKEKKEFLDTILKIAPLLYLKGALLPEFEQNEDIFLDDYVTEENYDIVRNNIACIMGASDDYLDVFMEDMKYSENPILTTISENLADIYQDLKNFAMAFKDGVEESRICAIAVCKDYFKYEWGQKLVNTMRALHDVRYNPQQENDEDSQYD